MGFVRLGWMRSLKCCEHKSVEWGSGKGDRKSKWKEIESETK